MRSRQRKVTPEQVRGGRIAALLSCAIGTGAAVPELTAAQLAELLPQIVRGGAAPLVWWAQRHGPLKDDRSATQLRHIFRTQALRAAVATRDLQRLMDASAKEGVEPLVGKGWTVARLYPAQGLRPYNDFDIFVPNEEFGRLVDMAKVVQATLAFPIDLHRGASHLDDRDFAAIRARSVTVPVETTHVRIFGAEDQLRLACLHLLAVGAIRPPWLCDVAVSLNRLPEHFDWDYFSSGDPRRTEWAFAALGLAGQLLHANLSRVPDRPLVRAQPPWLADAALHVWGQPGVDRGISSAGGGFRAQVGRLRWPNPIEATIGVRGRISDLPRLPYQLADATRRVTQLFS